MLETPRTARELSWRLVYTKPHAEAWVEVNLRKQGFELLLPRFVTRGGLRPLFPRYVFVGHSSEQSIEALHSTYGVAYVVMCGELPTRVPLDVITEIRSQMDSRGVVALEPPRRVDALFSRRERERVRTLLRLAHAGFRVKTA
jgi:hypothetical protein